MIEIRRELLNADVTREHPMYSTGKVNPKIFPELFQAPSANPKSEAQLPTIPLVPKWGPETTHRERVSTALKYYRGAMKAMFAMEQRTRVNK